MRVAALSLLLASGGSARPEPDGQASSERVLNMVARNGIELQKAPTRLARMQCPPGCAVTPAGLTVHGDPLVKINGTGTMLKVSHDLPTRLLTWESADADSMTLSAEAFTDPETNSEWFNKLFVSQNGVFVVTVTAQNGTVTTTLDDAVIDAKECNRDARKYKASSGIQLSCAVLPNAAHKIIQDHRNTQLKIEAHGLELGDAGGQKEPSKPQPPATA